MERLFRIYIQLSPDVKKIIIALKHWVINGKHLNLRAEILQVFGKHVKYLSIGEENTVKMFLIL